MTKPALEKDGRVPGRGRLENRRVLILGAGQQEYNLEDPPAGNGRAISQLIAREGASTALADLDEEALHATAEMVEGEGVAPIELVGDFANEEDLGRVVSEAADDMNGLDGLVANVGIVGGWGLEQTGAEEWDRVFAVNVRAHYLACRNALPLMDDGSAIVLISSIAAEMPANPVVAYHSSKSALVGLARWLAKEVAPRGIRVNIVVPGLIDTSLGRLASQAVEHREKMPVPLGRQGTAWEVAYATVFLLSDEASYITAQSLLVDGGLVDLR